jgi:hypothetical protein
LKSRIAEIRGHIDGNEERNTARLRQDLQSWEKAFSELRPTGKIFAGAVAVTVFEETDRFVVAYYDNRKPADLEIIAELPGMKKVGTVVVDDFHKLDEPLQRRLTDFLKVLADEEDAGSKLVLIGINRAGQALIDAAPDLLHRIDVVRFGTTTVEKLQEMITAGERALNCTISVKDEVVSEAEGSFAMAQVLCLEACLQAGFTEERRVAVEIKTSLPAAREAVLKDLSSRFFPVSRDFATGNKLRKEGRAPYLHLLRWLSETPDGVLDTREALAKNQELKGSVNQVLEKGHINTLLGGSKELSDLIHYKNELLVIEDPKMLYFIRHLIWAKFARQVGYYSVAFSSKYDFALSFAGEDRALAEALSQGLERHDIAVFYDKNEQHRILANDVEEYLAPIYRSESRFVVVLLSSRYPKKIWTKFESQQFKDRFGSNSVIPIWFKDCVPGLFDESSRKGGITFDPALDLHDQVAEIVDLLIKKLGEERGVDAKLDQ